MAAIIAQMAAANRARKKRQAEAAKAGGGGVAPNKASNHIQPFREAAFNPKKHNRFIKNKRENELRQFYLDKMTGKKVADSIYLWMCLHVGTFFLESMYFAAAMSLSL